MSNETYQRSQVESALWRTATFPRAIGPERPAIFATRIKRLLDTDRELPAEADAGGASFAFVTPGEGRGIETAFAPFDVFCLAVALDLLDVGFKQGEIVVIMRYLRPHLEPWFPKLIERPSLGDRQTRPASKFPELPKRYRDNGTALADARVFILLNRVELTEVFSMATPKTNAPAVLRPQIKEGVAGLQRALDKLMPLHRRTVIVIEIAATAQAVVAFLAQAPRVARGRPALKR